MILAISLGLEPYTPPKAKRTRTYDQFSKSAKQGTNLSNEAKQRMSEVEYMTILAQGEMTAAEVALVANREASIVNRSLNRLADRGLVALSDKPGRNGRPVKVWSLK